KTGLESTGSAVGIEALLARAAIVEGAQLLIRIGSGRALRCVLFDEGDDDRPRPRPHLILGELIPDAEERAALRGELSRCVPNGMKLPLDAPKPALLLLRAMLGHQLLAQLLGTLHHVFALGAVGIRSPSAMRPIGEIEGEADAGGFPVICAEI